jgi:hypothetical protein
MGFSVSFGIIYFVCLRVYFSGYFFVSLIGSFGSSFASFLLILILLKGLLGKTFQGVCTASSFF